MSEAYGRRKEGKFQLGWRNLVRFQGQNDFWKLGRPIVGVGHREERVWSERRGREREKQMDQEGLQK